LIWLTATTDTFNANYPAGFFTFTSYNFVGNRLHVSSS